MSISMVKLGEVAVINPRLAERPSADTTVSFIGMADVNAEYGTTTRGEDRPFSEVAKGYTQFIDSDILVAKITPCFENGKIAQASLGNPLGVGSTEFHLVRPDGSVLDTRYLLYYLRQPFIRIAGEHQMTGSAGQRRVPASFLSNLSIPFPSLQEQRAIAEVLDRVDALRSKRRGAIALLDELAQSIFLDMFGDPVLNPMGWPLRSLGDIGNVITGNTPRRSDSSNYGGDLEWIKSDNIHPSRIILTRAAEFISRKGERQARVVESGSLLVTCIAGSPTTIGNVAIADRRVAFNQQINAIAPHSATDARFLYALLRIGKRLVQDKSTGGMQGLVSKSRFESIQLISPPLGMQQDFSARALVLDEQKRRLLEHLEQVDALFVSVQQRAFRGVLWNN